MIPEKIIVELLLAARNTPEPALELLLRDAAEHIKRLSSPNMSRVIISIDFAELRNQKLELVRAGIECGWVEGLLNLIDNLQNAAVADAIATESEVFGESSED